MKRLLFGLLLLTGGLAAQTPDCIIPFTFTFAGQRSAINGCGRNVQGVFEWRVVYNSTGFAALSLRLESARDNNGVPGTWGAFTGTLISGVNPNTNTTSATTDMTGYNGFVSVSFTSGTGAGTISGTLYGCREPGCSAQGLAVTAIIPTPLPVDGPTAAGAAPTTPPVLVAGQDGAPGLIRTLKTDAAGELIPASASSADADAVSNTELAPTGAAAGILYPRVFNRVFNGTTWDRMRGNTTGVAPTSASSAGADGISNTQTTPTDSGSVVIYPRVDGMKFNGTTWDRDFVCPLSAPITFSAASGSVQIVGLVSGQVIRVCHLSISASVATNFTIQYGTGSNCGSGTNSLSGAYNNVTTLALDLFGTLRTPASQELCINSSASITAGGLVTYAQF